MWETSNTPASWRTARCSALIPACCTGISQPANSISLAPAARWRSSRGLRRRASVVEGTFSRLIHAPGGSGQPAGRQQLEVGVDHEADELLEAHPRLPAHLAFGFGGVADELVD